jgi:hypothetical protein
MTFFKSEYQNALANERKANWYITVFADSYTYYSPEGRDFVDYRSASSTGFIIPVWSNHKENGKENSWSLIGHATFVSNSFTDDIYGGWNLFGGGGIRANYGMLSFGFIGGYYTYNKGLLFEHNPQEYKFFKFAVPVSFGLSGRTTFIDKLTGYFGFDTDFDVKQILAELVFIPLRIIGLGKLGIDLYYKNEDYNMILGQQLIGAAFTTKYLQFDGGYRFFTSLLYNNRPVANGPYGRIIVHWPMSKDSGVAFSLALDCRDIEHSSATKIYFGVGLSFSGKMSQNFLEMGGNGGRVADWTLFSHINLRANEK